MTEGRPVGWARFSAHAVLKPMVGKIAHPTQDGFSPVLPRPAPEGLSGLARRGDAGMHRVLRRGWEAPSENPAQTPRSAGNKRHPGVFSFGYFSLDKQRKVPRLSGRDPTLNKASR